MMTIRVVLIGNAFVGKTALINRYLHKIDASNYEETVGAAFYTYYTIVNDEKIAVQVWDTAGQEKYRSLAPVYYRNAMAAIVVYDVTNRQSFYEVPSWIETFKSNAGENTDVIIVANKVDLDEDREVDDAEGDTLAAQCECHFLTTSAFTGANVQRLFQQIADIVVHTDRDAAKATTTSVKVRKENALCC